MNMRLNALYICVRDMERAIGFYEQLLDQPVTEKDSIYSVFDIHGFRLGLFAFEKVGEAHSYGSNCLPSLSLSSREQLEEKIADKALCFPLTKIKDNWVVEIVDSEGNHIEMTAPVIKEDSREQDELLKNLDRLHTTPMGEQRIRRNLKLYVEDVTAWCRSFIQENDVQIQRRGKNWYVQAGACEITINAGSYTVITGHRIKTAYCTEC